MQSAVSSALMPPTFFDLHWFNSLPELFSFFFFFLFYFIFKLYITVLDLPNIKMNQAVFLLSYSLGDEHPEGISSSAL